MAALRRRGDRVAPAKVGPDFIDPGYHALATGRPGRNLDAWMCGPRTASRRWRRRRRRGADLLVVEGVMGLFDGAADDGNPSSHRHVARLLDAPVVLVVDASAMSGSVGGARARVRDVRSAVRIGWGGAEPRRQSGATSSMLREALEPMGIPVLGALAPRRRARLARPPPRARPRRRAAGSGARGRSNGWPTPSTQSCDLDAIVGRSPGSRRGSRSAKPRRPGRAAGPASPSPAGRRSASRTRTTSRLLEQAGAELVPFDPLRDAALPAGSTACVAGGGFPEVLRRGARRQRARSWPTCAAGWRTASWRGPSAAGCCGWPLARRPRLGAACSTPRAT